MSTTILVGDRVKATNTKTGDLAEFTVTQLNQHAYGYSLESKTNFFAPDEGWTFEVIEPPKPTLTEQIVKTSKAITKLRNGLREAREEHDIKGYQTLAAELANLQARRVELNVRKMKLEAGV